MSQIKPILVPRLPPLFRSRRARLLAVLVIAALVVAAVASLSLIQRLVPMLLDAERLRATLATFGIFAPLAFVILQAAQVLLAPVPGQILALAGGYLFGPILGTAYSLIGVTIGSAIAFVLSRHYGRPLAERLLHPETLASVDGFIEARGRLAVFLVFLLPGLPDDALCLVAGLTKIPVSQLIVLSFVGRLPGYLLVSLAGAQLASRNLVEAGVLLGLLVVTTVLVFWKHDALLDRVS